MRRFFQRLFAKLQPQAGVYAVKRGSRWAKVVTYGRPKSEYMSGEDVLGPFRSEVDAEETVDALNGKRPSDRVRQSR